MDSSRVDIVLTTPPYSLQENFGSLDFVGYYGFPMNLLFLASSLKEAGFSVKIFDFSSERKSLKECAEQVVALEPNYVGIAVHFTFLVHKSLRLALLIKELNPGIKIIAGGIHFTAVSDEVMRQCPAIDLGILGEAEESLVELMQCLGCGGDVKKIKGIVCREGSGFFKSGLRGMIEDVNKLAFPSFDMIDISSYSLPLYKEKAKVSLPVSTSRGCPFLCNFCDRTIFGNKIRFFNTSYLSDMTDYLVRWFRINYIDITDENFCITRERLLEVCGMLGEKFRAHNITWGCLFRSDSVEADTGKLLYDSGCRSVIFGIESGSKKMLRVYNKSIDFDSLAYKCKIITNAGISLGGSFIIGGPEEDQGSISETIQLIKKIELDFMSLWYFIPLPGAAISKDIEQKGKLIGDYSQRTGHHVSFVPATLSKRQIETGYRKIYRGFYTKPAHMRIVLKKYGWKRIFALFKDALSYFKHFILK